MVKEKYYKYLQMSKFFVECWVSLPVCHLGLLAVASACTTSKGKSCCLFKRWSLVSLPAFTSIWEEGGSLFSCFFQISTSLFVEEFGSKVPRKKIMLLGCFWLHYIESYTLQMWSVTANGVQRERSHVVAYNVFRFLYKSLFESVCALSFSMSFPRQQLNLMPLLPQGWARGMGRCFAAKGAASRGAQAWLPHQWLFCLRQIFSEVVSAFWKYFAPSLNLPTSAPFRLQQPLNILHGWGETERTQCKCPKMEMKNLSDIWPETVLDFSWKREAF